jgi:trigger factor
MKSEIEITNSYTRAMRIEYSVEDISGMFDEKIKEIAKGVPVPGFRPGKAPKSIIIARYSSHISDQIKQELVSEKLAEALEKEGIEPLVIEKLEMGEPVLGEPFVITGEFHVKPEIGEVTYKAMSLEKPVFQPDQKSVDLAVDKLRERFATLEAIETPSESEDFVVSEFNDIIHYLHISNDLPQDTKDLLLGLKKGDTKTGSFVFPEKYIDNKIAGKTLDGTIEVIEVKRRTLPQLDLDFMKNVFSDIENEEAFYTNVRNGLQSEMDRRSQSVLENNAIEALVDANPLEISPSYVNQETLNMFSERYKIPVSSIPQEQADEIIKTFSDITRKGIVSRWLLAKIVETEGIDVSDDELVERAQMQATMWNVNPAQLFET